MQMMRSLFTVVLLSASGIAAHTAYGQQCSNPPAKPDLVINGISLEGYDHELVVRFINAGTAWADPVRLLVFVDGQELFNQNIFNWLSQESIVATGIHLLGGQRHIVVRVDSDDTEDEENELNNVLSTTLNVVRRDGFDLTVDALIDEQTDLLSVVVGNRGNAPTNGGESITIRVEDVTTGAVFLGWVNATLNLLLPGETQTIPTSIVIVPEADTRVAFWTMPADDLDNTNDAVVRRHMAASAVNTLYDDYLNVNPNVEAAIEWYPLWVDPQNPAPDPIPFVDWATQLPDMETRLRELLLDVEQGRPLPFANDLPQALPDSNSLTEDEAEELYLGILAHTLWFEVRGNDVLPGKNWSLAALDAEQLGMTSLRSRLSIRSSNPSHNPPGFNILHPLNGRVLYDFMSQTGILDADEAQTVWNLVGWTRSHMAHSNGIGYSARFTGESKAFPPAEEPLYVSNGCGGMNGFIYSLLPLLGIPVDGRGTELAVSGSGPWLPHSAFILPTIRKTPADDPGIAVSHSDNININGYPSFGLSFVPPNEIFFSITEYECLKAFFPDICPGECDASPPVGCTQNPACSQGTQPCELRNSYNGRRAWTLRGKEHLSGEWVHRYYDPNQGPIVAEDYMTCPNGNLTQCYVDDLLTQDERTDFLADLDAASCEYGNSSDPMTWNTIDRLKQIHFGGSRFTFLVDCNENGVSDDDDIGGGTSTDSNANGVPDECEPDCGSNCDDGNDCTDDTCTGICLNTIDDTNMCSDGQFCTTGESCTAGVCGGGSATDCSALDDQCSVGVCNEATSACEAQPINEGLSCDDDYACTEIDVCASGSCVGSTIPGCKICSTTPGCFNGNACTDYACVAGICEYPNKPDGTTCDDGDPCTELDACSSGTCVGSPIGGCPSCTTDADCDDGNACTDDVCVSNSCTNTNEPIGTTCDDGQFCTTGETCTSGVCGGGSATDCSSSSDQCNTGVCNETTDVCDAQPANEGLGCIDGQFCTTGETCTSGVCGGGSAIDCSGSADQCNTGICNEITNACEAQPANEGLSCNDDDVCTESDVCSNGTCTGSPIGGCGCVTNADCNDGNDCTADVCASGTCSNTNEPNGTTCDDGQFCTTGETCTSGVCGGGSATDCSGSSDQCNTGVCNETSDACEGQPANEGLSCDDGQFCTTGETCTAGVCGGGSATDCSGASDQCNTGVCNETTDACEAQPANEGESCDDGQFCTTGEACTAGVCGSGSATDCSGSSDQCNTGVCNETTNVCDAQAANEGLSCDDGQFCTTGEACTAGVCGGGSATDCSGSSDQCNTGVCNETTNACEAQPANEGQSCDDADICTESDVCSNGTCAGSPIGGCECVTDVDCDDGNECTVDTCVSGDCTSANEPVGTACDDGLFCTATDECDGSGMCVGSGSPCGGRAPYCCEYLSICTLLPCS